MKEYVDVSIDVSCMCVDRTRKR